MSTYTNDIKVHNEWRDNLKGVWIRYGKSDSSRYFDFNSINIPNGSDLEVAPPDEPIQTESGVTDYWTVSFVDQQDRLWGTEQFITANVPHQDGVIEIILENTEIAPNYYQAIFKMPDGSSKVFDIYRL